MTRRFEKKTIEKHTVREKTCFVHCNLVGPIAVEAGVTAWFDACDVAVAGDEGLRLELESDAVAYFQDCSGHVRVTKLEDAVVRVFLDPGKLTVEDTCRAGLVIAEGVGRYEDHSSGDVTVVVRNLWNPEPH